MEKGWWNKNRRCFQRLCTAVSRKNNNSKCKLEFRDLKSITLQHFGRDKFWVKRGNKIRTAYVFNDFALFLHYCGYLYFRLKLGSFHFSYRGRLHIEFKFWQSKNFSLGFYKGKAIKWSCLCFQWFFPATYLLHYCGFLYIRCNCP